MNLYSYILRAGVGLTALATAACSTPLANGPEEAYDRTARFPISVHPSMMTLRLVYNGQSALDENARGQIARFAQQYLSSGSGSLAVAAPNGNAAASNLAIEELLAHGVGRNQIMVGAANASRPSDDITITFIRYVAESPACGDWSSNLGFTASNTRPPNFGCTTQHNIAAMVSDPRDLVLPDTSGQPDAQRRLTVLDKFRKGEPTPAEKTDDQTAVLSAVGQM
jgi:pilus assembly protein CpaD